VVWGGGACWDLAGQDRYGAAICRYFVRLVGCGRRGNLERDSWLNEVDVLPVHTALDNPSSV